MVVENPLLFNFQVEDIIAKDWNEKIETVAERMRIAEQQRVSFHTESVIFLINELRSAMQKQDINAKKAKAIIKEIIFLARCYGIRRYPNIDDELKALQDFYKSTYTNKKTKTSFNTVV
ncbi:MAG: hypothetical protein WC838_02995 [Candidatus Margulisiibacteriota bacterium]